ncbi:ATP-grasp domain-containing protein [Treponema pectinovorum]|uniref:ATP-grasp domain-containing protein n=1 Tax=Treponema pectinovorum TaxID=164 RepID=UPI003D9429F4
MEQQKIVMILGAGLMQGPAIIAAKELGYKTVVVDANPLAVCAKDADCFKVVDLKDKQGLYSLAKSITEDKNSSLAAVFTAGTDFSANTAYLAQEFSLKGHSYQACLNASNKVLMRECFAKDKVPSPNFREVDEKNLSEIEKLAEEGKIEFPKVIKPVDNMGGRGCRLARSKEELHESLLTAIKNSRSGKAIFEDYMEGPEFSIDSVVYNGTLTITGFADRHIYYPPYFIETGHTIPSKIDEKMKAELIATFALGIKSLGLTHGVAKADIKYTKDGPMIGEIAARLSGGYMSGWTYPFSSNLFLTKEALKISLGKEPDELLKRRKTIKWIPHKSVSSQAQPFELFEVKSEKVSAERAWMSIPGKIAFVKGLDEARSSESVKEVFPRNKAGDTVNFPRNNVEKCGNVITLADSYEEAQNFAKLAIGKITLILELKNKATDDFLLNVESEDEKGFPPSAFDVKIDWSKVKDIPENSKVSLFIPEELKSCADEIFDWNLLTVSQVAQKFDKLMPIHKKLDGKNFWNAFLRGSIQAILYVAGYEAKP